MALQISVLMLGRQMADKGDEVPEEVRRQLKVPLLDQLKGEDGLDVYELSLFAWYTRENGRLIERMLLAERAYIQEQLEAGVEDLNDSGMVAVEYYIKRVRYADIIYMTSLLETYLDRACEKLMPAVGDQYALFRPNELMGDKWAKRKKFLERYGKFEFPESIWSELRMLILVRNNLVHDNGDPATLNEDDKKRLRERPGISVDRAELVIEDDYIRHCFAAFQSLVQFIDSRLNEIVDRALRPQGVK